uniref:DNA-directed DNA polymerase n=1 Tax=Panagrolaimus superbus TaxID=310955 RepID=A0A914YYF1_9BILA
MAAKRAKKDESLSKRNGLFHYKHDLRHDISPFVNTFRSYIYESRSDKNCHKVRDMKNEVDVLRQIMNMKNSAPRFFDLDKAEKDIMEIAGINQDGSPVCPETQMENCCKFLQEYTGKEIVGYYFHEGHDRPKYVSDSYVGDFNLILIKMKTGKFATASRFNIFNKDGKYFCPACRKFIKQSSTHTSSCKIRCRHCFGMGKDFPCPQELEDGHWLKCNSCRFEFKSQKCFEQHLVTACHKKVLCEKCNKPSSTRPGDHICYSSFCEKCSLIHPVNVPEKNLNYCYIKPVKLVLQRDFKRVIKIVYDIETHPIFISEIPKKTTSFRHPDEFDRESLEGENEYIGTDDEFDDEDNGVQNQSQCESVGLSNIRIDSDDESINVDSADESIHVDSDDESIHVDSDDESIHVDSDDESIHVSDGLESVVQNTQVDTESNIGDPKSPGESIYMSKLGTHNDEIMPDTHIHDFARPTQWNGPEIDEFGIVDYELADDEAADNFETQWDYEMNMKSTYRHEANLLCAKIRCSDCFDVVTDDYTCDYCPHTTVSFTTVPGTEGAQEVENVCEEFKKYLIDLTELKGIAGIYCFAHNAARFDTHLVIKSFIDDSYYPDNLIMKGNSIIQTSFYGDQIATRIHFRDTYRLIPVALKAFQKTFELPEDIVKFDFPHLYNRPEFYEEVLDSLPDIEYFGFMEMKEEDQKVFKAKYDRICQEMMEKGEKYRLPEQLLKYCLQDVEVLYQGFLTHCTNLNEITKEKVDAIDLSKPGKGLGKNSDLKYFDLVLRGSTIASLALYIFRLKYLKWETVALVPETGYQQNINQSKLAIAYMDWLVHTKQAAIIKHRDNNGEEKIGDMYVDGFDSINNTVYQVMGCQWHGCIKCKQANRSSIQWNGKSANELYEETVRKQKKLQNILNLHYYRNYKLVELWECDISAERKLNPDLDTFIKEHDDTSPINLRQTLTGGRTGPLILEAEASDEWEIKYFDICSLYPYINFVTRYPIKHPEIRYQVPAYKNHWEVPQYAMVKCKILAPKNLTLPIIPKKHRGQLLFPLCGRCPDLFFDKNEEKVSCPHTDAERAFVVETTSMELKYAMENGYKCLQIFHVLEYAEGSDNLFKGYVREFLKTKIEASHPPPGYETNPEIRRRFQDLYQTIYGIDIGDSLWGKFSMGTFEEKMVVSNGDLFKYMADPTIYDLTYHQVTEDTMMIRYKTDSNYSFAPNVNLVVSLWTTAAAKLHLYRFMKCLELDKILKGEENNPLKAGELLGEMTDEMPSKIITHYRSGGAKQYYLKYKDKKTGEEGTSCKLRGIIANAETEKEITYDTMEYDPSNVVTLKHTTIGPHHDFSILTRNTTKIYRTTCKKGIIWEKNVFPYGWDFEADAYMAPWNPQTDNFEVTLNAFTF